MTLDQSIQMQVSTIMDTLSQTSTILKHQDNDPYVKTITHIYLTATALLHADEANPDILINHAKTYTVHELSTLYTTGLYASAVPEPLHALYRAKIKQLVMLMTSPGHTHTSETITTELSNLIHRILNQYPKPQPIV